MMRRLGFICVILFACALVQAQDVPAEWSGAYQTVAGDTGPLTCKVSSNAPDTYKATLLAVQYGFEFELNGKKEADKIVFTGTTNTDMGPFEFQGEIINQKFSGRFKSQAYNGSFELTPTQTIAGDWAGSYQTTSGMSGELKAQVKGGAGESIVAVFTVVEPGLQFELPGKKEADKALFAASITPSADMGTLEVKGELANDKFTGTFAGQTVSGTFELRPVKK